MSRLAVVTATTFIALAPPPAVRAQLAAGPLPVGNTLDQRQTTGSQKQLLQVVAPVAQYIDLVLTNILAAAPYLTQVVEAQRFVTDQPMSACRATRW